MSHTLDSSIKKGTRNALEQCVSLLNVLLAAQPDEIRPLALQLLDKYKRAAAEAPNDMVESVLASHKAMCEAKQMGTKEAFGHDPAVFYALGLAGECGELANGLIKVMRTGGTPEQKREAISQELCDVLIYAIILAYTNDIDPHTLVAEKASVVIDRARSGYYGGPLIRQTGSGYYNSPPIKQSED